MKTLNDLKKALTAQNLELEIENHSEDIFYITTSFKGVFDMPTGFDILSFRIENLPFCSVITLTVKF